MMFRLFTKYDVFKKIIELPTTRLSRMLSSDVFCKTSGDTLKNTKPNYKVVMIRHGQSTWNKKNLFCGWYDSELSSNGIKEATDAGKTLKRENYEFDIAYTSVLKRAQYTLCKIFSELNQTNIPRVYATWRLNERHYGELTGLNKAETARKYGEPQVKIWRRSFDIPPPPMTVDHMYYDRIVNDPRYKNEPSKDEFPMFESLKSTMERTLPYWDQVIIPQIKLGKRVFISAHGNSLRGIIKHLDNISDEEIVNINIPTGIPFEYIFDENIKPITSLKFLGDKETVKRAMDAVAAQGKAK